MVSRNLHVITGKIGRLFSSPHKPLPGEAGFCWITDMGWPMVVEFCNWGGFGCWWAMWCCVDGGYTGNCRGSAFNPGILPYPGSPGRDWKWSVVGSDPGGCAGIIGRVCTNGGGDCSCCFGEIIPAPIVIFTGGDMGPGAPEGGVCRSSEDRF